MQGGFFNLALSLSHTRTLTPLPPPPHYCLVVSASSANTNVHILRHITYMHAGTRALAYCINGRKVVVTDKMRTDKLNTPSLGAELAEPVTISPPPPLKLIEDYSYAIRYNWVAATYPCRYSVTCTIYCAPLNTDKRAMLMDRCALKVTWAEVLLYPERGGADVSQACRRHCRSHAGAAI